MRWVRRSSVSSVGRGRLVGTELLDHTDAYTTLHAAAQVHIGVDKFIDAEATRTITNGLTYTAGHLTHIRRNCI